MLALPGCGEAAPPRSQWQVLDLGLDVEFHDAFFHDDHHGWIVGGSHRFDGGVLGRTEDGGATWDFQKGLLGKGQTMSLQIRRITFVDEDTGFLVGDGGAILATYDGGDSWERVHWGTRSYHALRDLQFVDDGTGWAVGRLGVLKSEDDGSTWLAAGEKTDWGHSIRANALHFSDAERGWVVGLDGLIARTDDGGDTWSAVKVSFPDGDPPSLYDIDFVDDRCGWIVGRGGTILHTQDGGTNWSHQETNVDGAQAEKQFEQLGGDNGRVEIGSRPGLILTSVHFVDRQHGYTVGHFGTGERSLVLHTIDGGASWHIDTEVAQEKLERLCVLDSGHAWIVGGRSQPGQRKMLRLQPTTDNEPHAAPR